MEILILNNSLRINYLRAYIDKDQSAQKKLLVPRLSVLGDAVPPEFEILTVEDSVFTDLDKHEIGNQLKEDRESKLLKALKSFASKNRRRTKFFYRIWWRTRGARRFVELFLARGRKLWNHLNAVLLRKSVKEVTEACGIRTVSSVLNEQLITGRIKEVVLFDVDILPQVSELCRNFNVDLRVI